MEGGKKAALLPPARTSPTQPCSSFCSAGHHDSIHCIDMVSYHKPPALPPAAHTTCVASPCYAFRVPQLHPRPVAIRILRPPNPTKLTHSPHTNHLLCSSPSVQGSTTLYSTCRYTHPTAIETPPMPAPAAMPHTTSTPSNPPSWHLPPGPLCPLRSAACPSPLSSGRQSRPWGQSCWSTVWEVWGA